jgi:hypothetical protein
MELEKFMTGIHTVIPQKKPNFFFTLIIKTKKFCENKGKENEYYFCYKSS